MLLILTLACALNQARIGSEAALAFAMSGDHEHFELQ